MPDRHLPIRRPRSRTVRKPAVRIRTSSRPDGPSALPSSGTDDPLDHLHAIYPTELVPDSTSSAPGEPVFVFAADEDLESHEELTFDDYISRIEDSAARLRAEHDGPVIRRRSQMPQSQPRRPLRRRRTSPQDTRPWYRRRKTWFIAAMVVPLLFVAGASAYVLNIIRVSVDAYGDIHEDPVDRVRYEVNPEGTAVPIPSAQIETVLPNWENDDPVNIVLLGVDARTGEDEPPRSDTTIVVHVDPASSDVSMMSIPRDLIVFIPGFGEDKFNAAYPLGEANEDEIPGGGPTLVAQTVEANFNIPIHYFATIDFNGFKDVVDTVGGVIVDVETQLSDNLYPTDDLRLTRVYFPAGVQKMDGETALQYVRTRHADSDFGRADRQQQVLMAIREQAVSLDLITQAQSLIRDMQDTVRTDLNFNEMLALANLGRSVQEQDIVRFNLWDEGLLVEHLPEFQGDAYFIEADWENVLIETRAFFDGVPVAATSNPGDDESDAPDFTISVFVENAASIPFLAGSSAQVLVDAGYEEVWPVDARRPQGTTRIQVAPEDVATARHIADILGLPESTIVTISGSDAITVTLGGDVPAELIPDPDSEQFAG